MKYSFGAIRQKNNHLVSERIPLPQSVEMYPIDGERPKTVWCEGLIVRSAYLKDRQVYQVTVEEHFRNADAEEVIKACEPQREEEFGSFLKAYLATLFRYRIAEVPVSLSIMSQIEPSGSGSLPSTTRPLEDLYFSAAVCSLTKPLFRHLEPGLVDADFALQILPGERLLEAAAKRSEPSWPVWAINDCADLWCNFRPWERRDEKVPLHGMRFSSKPTRKFRNRWEPLPATAYWLHRGLPLVYSDYKGRTWGETSETDYYQDRTDEKDDRLIELYNYEGKERLEQEAKRREGSARRARQLVERIEQKALLMTREERHVEPVMDRGALERVTHNNCLPILIPDSKPERPYPSDLCLTITWESDDPSAEYRAMKAMFGNACPRGYLENTHANIIGFYREFKEKCREINENTLRKKLKKAFRQALRDLGLEKGYQDAEWQHKACLFAAVYLAREVFPQEEVSISRYIDCLVSLLVRRADARAFAAFVQATLTKDSEYAGYLFKFEEGDAWIYLKNNYWQGFCRFCAKNRLYLDQNRLEFLKSQLIPGGYLKGASRTQKYTFTITINKSRTVVCKISSKILGLIGKKRPAQSLRTDPALSEVLPNYEETLRTWQRVTTKRNRQEIQDMLFRNFVPEFIENSISISRPKLTKKEIRSVLSDLPLRSAMTAQDIMWVYNGRVATVGLLKAFGDRIPMSLHLVRSLQKEATKDIYSEALTKAGEEPGEFRRNSNVAGDRQNKEAELIPMALEDLIGSVQELPPGQELLGAAELLAGVMRISPFADGNGRVARLLMNHWLLNRGHPPIVIHSEDKQAFCAAIDRHAATGRYDKLIAFLQEQTARTWGPYLHILEQASEE